MNKSKKNDRNWLFPRSRGGEELSEFRIFLEMISLLVYKFKKNVNSTVFSTWAWDGKTASTAVYEQESTAHQRQSFPSESYHIKANVLKERLPLLLCCFHFKWSFAIRQIICCSHVITGHHLNLQISDIWNCLWIWTSYWSQSLNWKLL